MRAQVRNQHIRVTSPLYISLYVFLSSRDGDSIDAADHITGSPAPDLESTLGVSPFSASIVCVKLRGSRPRVRRHLSAFFMLLCDEITNEIQVVSRPMSSLIAE